jgi:large subunit ribosomal protein L30
MAKNTEKQLKITLKRSTIAASGNQKKVVKALGFTKTSQTVVHNDSPTIRGMINKVSHMVEVA